MFLPVFAPVRFDEKAAICILSLGTRFQRPRFPLWRHNKWMRCAYKPYIGFAGRMTNPAANTSRRVDKR